MVFEFDNLPQEEKERLLRIWNNSDERKKVLAQIDRAREVIETQEKGINFVVQQRIGVGKERNIKTIDPIIRKWLKVSERIIHERITHPTHQDQERAQRNLERIKSFFHKQIELIPTVETFPLEEYKKAKQRIAWQRGRGDIEEVTRKEIEAEIANMKETLDKWIEYFTSSYSQSIPIWAKYWAFMGIIKLSGAERIDEDNNISFTERSKKTLKGYPELNREALAMSVQYIRDMVERKGSSEEINDELQKTSFKDVYTYFLNKLRREKITSQLEITEGEWVKYPQNADDETVQRFLRSIEGKNTGWCIASEGTAKDYLSRGDLWVYYSKSDSGPFPRIGISASGNNVLEVRGTAAQEHIDRFIAQTDILEKKLEEFGDGGRIYKRTEEDMRRITEIYNRFINESVMCKITDEEREFLETEPWGFGDGPDPRAEEIISFINLKEKYEILEFDKQTIERIISEGDDMVNFLDCIEFISPKARLIVAETLLDSGYGWYIPSRLEKFIDLNHVDLANRLIDGDDGWAVVEYLENFKGLNHEDVANRLIDAGKGASVANNLEKFKGLNHVDLANRLIEEDRGWAVADNLEKFKGLNHIEIANRLIDTGQGKDVMENINKFVGLNDEIAIKLIKKGFIKIVNLPDFKMNFTGIEYLLENGLGNL